MNVTLFEAKLIAVIAFKTTDSPSMNRPENIAQTSSAFWPEEFGELIGKKPHQVKGVVKTLEKKGLVDFVPETADDYTISLTDEGLALFNKELCPRGSTMSDCLAEVDQYFEGRPTNNQKAEAKNLPFCDEAGFADREKVENATMQELLAYYNANVAADKMVKKFASHDAAVKKVLTLLSVQLALGGESAADKASDAILKAKSDGVKVHKTRKAKQKSKPDPEPADDENLSDEEWEAQMRAQFNQSEGENDNKPAKKTSFGGSRSNAPGIAESWRDKSVKEARLTRNGVSVTVGNKTTEHKSVRAAFAAYSLPDSKHIRFRLKLKEAKTAIFEHDAIQYLFKLQ